MNAIFQSDYVGKKVIIITNEVGGVIYATVDRIHVTGINNDIRLVIYKDENGKDFVCQGIIIPWSAQMQQLIETAVKIWPDPKELFWSIVSIKNFSRDIDYVVNRE